MEKRKLVLTIIGVVILAMVIMVYIYFSKPGKDEKKNQQTINQVQTVQQKTNEKKENTEKNTSGDELENVTPGSEEYRGFLLDNVLHSPNEGDIHYNVYIPDAYDGTKEYALYVTLPGYQGLYFQGVGENIRTEDFGFEAQKYITDMIIVAPQLNDWGQTSADQTIELTQYFLTIILLIHRKYILMVIPEEEKPCHWYWQSSRNYIQRHLCAALSGMVHMSRLWR